MVDLGPAIKVERPQKIFLFTHSFLILFFFLFASPVFLCYSEETLIQAVSVSKEFFNPGLNEKVQFSFVVKESGFASVQVLDRDGYLVRTLTSKKRVEVGKTSVDWDGRNDAGEIVPDEAYSFKIDFVSNQKTEIYFPANSPASELLVALGYYDRQNGIISYQLQRPARVHMQAGVAKVDPLTKKPDGPVMKTIVNREPRSSGSIVERWNGFDESGSIYVPDLLDFKMAIAATGLPENSVICIGNRSADFMNSAVKRKGKSLLTFHVNDHRHHQGLDALEDSSPALKLSLANAEWSSSKKTWEINSGFLRVNGNLAGPSSTSFSNQPGKILIYIDGKAVKTSRPLGAQFLVDIPITSLPTGQHILAVNWSSDYGPTAANSLAFLKSEAIVLPGKATKE